VVLNPVSKGGNTLETIANFLALSCHRDLNIADTVVTTGSEKGALATYARERALPVLHIPEDVGGRFSVLSPVALFPLAFLGYPIERLLEGAREALPTLRVDDYEENPALALAARLYVLVDRHGFDQLLLWSYCDALHEWGRWWVQLFAESLGKQRQDRDENRAVGLTPMAVLGPAAQHSMLQLVLDGPRDKTCGFIEVARPKVQLPAFGDLPTAMQEFQYLQDKRLHEVVTAGLRGTRESLRQRGCPSFLLKLPSLEPEAVGELILFFEVVASLMGVFLGINPFDQPAVDESKRLARELLETSLS